MTQLHDLIRCEIEVASTTLRAVAIACGISYPKLNAALNNYSALDYRDVSAIEHRLGLGYGFFAQQMSPTTENPADSDAVLLLNQALRLARQQKVRRANRVTMKQFLDWWYSHSGRMEEFETIRDRVDVFSTPKNGSQLIQPLRAGRQSLASLHFELQNTQHLTRTLEGFSPNLNRDLVGAHMMALNKGEPVLSHPSLNEVLPSGRTFKRTYRRILAPVRDDKGNTYIVNYSEDISA